MHFQFPSGLQLKEKNSDCFLFKELRKSVLIYFSNLVFPVVVPNHSTVFLGDESFGGGWLCGAFFTQKNDPNDGKRSFYGVGFLRAEGFHGVWLWGACRSKPFGWICGSARASRLRVEQAARQKKGIARLAVSSTFGLCFWSS